MRHDDGTTTPRTVFVVLATLVAVAMLVGPSERLSRRTLSVGGAAGRAAPRGRGAGRGCPSFPPAHALFT
ncbi:hypothetical protein ACFVUW_29010 [Streptomyces xiamenensis]|uniref:hypothetical protein n=1 Tax=Streptomyces xiamenensis TaxID=408015 RepID=UPI0036F187B0